MSAKTTATPPKKGSRKKSAGNSAVAKIPQPHGGALLAGGMPGNKGGSGGGRPRSIIRDDVLLSFDTKARQFMDDVVAGVVMSKTKVKLAAVAKHITFACPCGKAGPAAPVGISEGCVEFEVQTSAPVNQRLEVAEMMMRYGLGGLKEVSTDAVRDKVNRTLDVLQAQLSAEQYTAICKQLEPIWTR